MIHRPSSMTAGGGPVRGPRPLLDDRVTKGKGSHFAGLLKRAPATLDPPELAAARASLLLANGATEAREFLRSRSSPPLEGDLVPDKASLPGHGPGDLAELFALFSPTVGVMTASAPLEPAPGTPSSVAQVAELVERWVRRVSVGGDQRRSVARLEIGEGRYAGAELRVSAEAGHVSVDLTLPSGPLDERLSKKLLARLEQRGLSADVTVR